MRLATLVSCALLVMCCGAAGQERMATVGGDCYLMDAADHSGSKVLFEAQSPSAVTDSTYTDALGHYTIGLSEGIYAISCSHDGYVPHFFPDHHTFGSGSHSLPDVTLAGPAIEVSGVVSGEWTPDYLYSVVGNLLVEAGDTLLVHPGTSVLFMGDYGLTVNGALLAIGTASDSIRFTSGLPVKAPGDWSCIDFWEDSAHCALQHSVVEYGGSGDRGCVEVWNTGFSAIRIQNSAIRRSDRYGIYCAAAESTCVIVENTITACASTGIEFHWGTGFNTSPIIRSNSISYCSTGIGGQPDHPTIEGNLVSDITGSGITGACWAVVTENTIQRVGANGIRGGTVILSNLLVDCTVGIFADSGSLVAGNTVIGSATEGIVANAGGSTVVNNIVTGCDIGIGSYGGLLDILYNDVWGNTDDYAGVLPPDIGVPITTNANGDSCDTYFNISMDPLFQGAEDYHLTAGSPCVDAGDPDSLYIDPDGTIADMGAFPHHQGSPGPPVIDFAASDTVGVSPLPVEFTPSNAGGPITDWLWDFGDGGASALPNPVHTYFATEDTLFTVSLMVQGPGGGDSISYPDLISVLAPTTPPKADFTAEPLVGYGVVHFTDRSIGQIDTYDWQFGDGGISDERNPTYEYPDPGIYTVTLTVTGPHGGDTEVKTDYITILYPETVVAGFEASALSGVVPLVVSFTNTSQGTIESYAWDFGDSATSDGENPVHTYLSAGLYDVVLIATGPANSDTASAVIEVLSAEPVITSIEDVPGDQGGQVYVRFVRSGHDTNAPRSAESYTIERNDDGTWVAVASGSAYGQDQYDYLAPTLRDSVPGDDGLTEFRVVAAMDEGSFLSDPAWGYSVDDIAPAPPGGLIAAAGPGVVSLSWSPTDADDLAYYAVYRDTVEGFEPGTPIGFSAGEAYDDTDPPGAGPLWYRVSAVDAHGNEGDPSQSASPLGAGAEGVLSTAFVLGPAVPNPFNPVTEISYWVPSWAAGTRRALVVYDVTGRRVRTLVDGPSAPGHQTAVWDGRDDSGAAVSSGVYLYRLEAEGFRAERKMALLK